MKDGHEGKGSVQEFVDGKDAMKEFGSNVYRRTGQVNNIGGREVPNEKMAEYVKNNTDDVVKMRVFDYLIGNTDRHGGNYRVDSDGRLKLTDNGFSFPNQNSGRHLKRNITSLLKSYADYKPSAELKGSVARIVGARRSQVDRMLKKNKISGEQRREFFKRADRLHQDFQSGIGTAWHNTIMKNDL